MESRQAIVNKARLVIVHAAGLCVAAGSAAGLFALTSFDAKIYSAAFLVALAHAFILGLPVYLALRAHSSLRWWHAPIGGFLVGCVPIGVLGLVFSADQASTGNVATVINGARTAAGWLEYLTLTSGLGALGAVGGFAFGLCVQGSLSPNEFGHRRSTQRSWIRWIGEFFAIGLAGVFLIAAIELPRLLEDRSCHNPMRGRNSLGSEINATLSISSAEWPDFVAIAQDFSRKNGWSYLGDVRPSPDLEWLQISMCDTRGTEFSAIFAQPLPGIEIAVSQPQGGDSWRKPYSDFYRAFHTRWPTRITFSDHRGKPMQPPEWLASSEQKK